MSLLSNNEITPDFTLATQNNTPLTLSSLKGKWIVLYFYPKALTSGCTLQAQQLQSASETFSELNTVILGISPDQPEKLTQFAAKEGLEFTLLSDPNHTVCETYGTWQEKSMYGRTYMGVARTTYIINPEGLIHSTLKNVKPKTHLDAVLDTLKTAKNKL